MYNIKQLTQADMTGVSTVQKTVRKGGDLGETVTIDYYDITTAKLGSANVTKMGYCANSNPARNLPIFLTLNGIETEFQLGKTGMFEFHDENGEHQGEFRFDGSQNYGIETDHGLKCMELWHKQTGR